MSLTLKVKLVAVSMATVGGTHRWLPSWLLLTIAALTGLAGVLLSEQQSTPWIKIALPLAFAAALSLFAASVFRGPLDGSDAARLPIGPRPLVRVISRQIYLLLYTLAASKETQYFLQVHSTQLALQDAMHGLWPYFVGGLMALVLSRVLALRLRA